jgi:hypothetical protein
MKDELKLPDDVKRDMRSALETTAPVSILQNVLSRVKSKKKVNYVPDLQMPFVLTLSLIIAAGYLFYTRNLSTTKASLGMSFELEGILISNIFWFSLMAVSAVVLLDLLNQQRKEKKNNE